ncbi:MAG: cysteine--tRNA ligase [Gammaproteobacteria bacterium]|nr:cysteine--tRNA ligase [Gammaproteobacteria bacterium]
MELTLHNTLSGRKEVFRPIDRQRVTMYVCGPTVYGHVHIGNGRPAVVFDVLYRVLQALYPNVVYACNVTDVDDKINRQALANGEPIEALAERFTRAYNEDIAALGVLETGLQPRATEHIAEIVEMIGELIEKGFAYEAEGHVLFHVPADPGYGSLSGRSLEDMLDGARVEVAPYKRDPKDFVLWKPSTPELPGWASPWGRGRPGWHIECSAMIRKHLGTSIDIHGGGSDLTFPHHENESAQSRSANDSADYVRYWLHNGMLTMGEEKMSKSLGNIVTIDGLRERHAGETLRYALLSGQYRSPLAWSDALLEQARRSLDALYQALRGSGASASEVASAHRHGPASGFPEPVLLALLDDLNTPAALAAMHGIAAELNKASGEAETIRLRRALLAGGWLLGLLDQTPDAWFQGPSASGSALEPKAIQQLIDERTAARRGRDFATADRIRHELAKSGIELEDTREGTLWKRVTRS